MDPSTLGHLEWSELGKLLTSLWIVVLFIVLFAANIIVGHNFLPSFIMSGHVPQAFHKARIAFYVFAFTCLAIAVYFIIQVIGLTAGVLQRFWPDFYL